MYILYVCFDLSIWSDKCAGPDHLDNLRKLAEQLQKGGGGGLDDKTGQENGEDDDDVPDLIPGETFEAAAAAEEGHVAAS